MNGYPFIFGAGAGLGGGGSISSLVVSDTTPTTGDTITLTATASGFTPASYLFFTYDGSTIDIIVEQATNTYNWFVDRAGTYDIYVLATDGTVSAYGSTSLVGTSSLLLDSIGVSPNWAVSLRRLTTNYTGYACRVMRSSDSTTLDVGFVGENLDTAALTAFVGAGNGFSATLYDQVGSINATQSTAANIPSAVVSGTIQTINGKPTILFDGSNDEMLLSSNVTFAHGFAVAAKISNLNTYQYILGGVDQGLSSGGTGLNFIFVANSVGTQVSTVNNTNIHQVSFKFGSGSRLRVDGVTMSTTAMGASMTIGKIGTRADAAQRHYGYFSEAITFASAISDANELIIEANQKAYYGTP